MSTPAESVPSRSGAISQALSDQLPASAQRELNALRNSVENRLAVLEAVLADPSRGESLESLILDLSRAAAEEAQAAASIVCLAAKAEAERQIAEVRASADGGLKSAQTALKAACDTMEQERQVSAELRRTLEQEKQESAALERRKAAEAVTARAQLEGELGKVRERLEADLKSVRERLEAEVARQQALVVDLQRKAAEAQRQVTDAQRQATDAQRQLADAARQATDAQRQLADVARQAADAQQQVQAEREASVDLRRLAERADTRVAVLESENTEARAALEAVVTELAQARDATAGWQRAHAETESQLEAERAISEGLRRAAERAEELTSTIGHEAKQVMAAQGEFSAELARQRDEAADLQKALADMQAEVDAERASNATLRDAVDQAEKRLSSVVADKVQSLADHDQIAAQLEAARASLSALTTERDTIAGELKVAQLWIEEARAAESEFAAPSSAAGKAAAKAGAHAAPAKQTPPAKPAAPPDDDWQAVRLADRYIFRKAIAVHINGDPGLLCDLSTSGCQVMSPAALKPNHMVKVLLPSDKTGITCAGKIVWTRLEPPVAGRPLGYRAGVHFTKADEAAIEQFAATHGAV